MQYVRSISGSVSKTWNSINPATLSGAIDVIVVEGEDGTLACSPFHVRFGKFSLLRPSEKKIEFKVNNVKQNYAMKLGDGGEAFFVFETSDNIPEAMQTSPLISPASSPPLQPEGSELLNLSEPEFLDLETMNGKARAPSVSRPGVNIVPGSGDRRQSNLSAITPLSGSPDFSTLRPHLGDWSVAQRSNTDELLSTSAQSYTNDGTERDRQTRSLTPTIPHDGRSDSHTERSQSPPPLPTKEAIERAVALSNKLQASNIRNTVTDTGDLMLDMTGYKSSDDDAFRAEVIARKILSEELDGNYDIGALIGADEQGNLWIYSSEEAKEAAAQRAAMAGITNVNDAASDPGYHSDAESEGTPKTPVVAIHRRADSDLGLTPPQTPPEGAGDPNRNYAKTLRLTSDQLKALGLKAGPNPMSFTVNRVTCQANMYLWRYDVPVVISDIDGTITKSDALGHILNLIGRDWTHIGVAKLYTEIVNNGYNIMYLTSRSVGLADNTRAYLAGVEQEGYRLPKGPTIMSPDRTIAALRREVYLRKPEVFKMACLRDIKNLFGPGRTPFCAGFGNRLTDALSYRSVSIPSNRIFTINSNAEVSLDVLKLNKLRYSYVNMREIVDHYFPPVNTLVRSGGEEYTDFTYWREPVLEIDDFSASESGESDGEDEGDDEGDDEEDDNETEDEEENEEMGESYMSRGSLDEGEGYNGLEESMMSTFSQEEEHIDNTLDATLDGNVGQEEEVEADVVIAQEPETGLLQVQGVEETTKAMNKPTNGEDDMKETKPDVHHRRVSQQDIQAELITGLKGLGLEREESDDRKV
ncbi:hypothetical protein HYFRA_00012352 [Hymenoscyphus fraxineus]|uniref:LNS2/PITP domain-containing protein n=1 Tax=Hymenoscyphus fraxineus TaxID=746836 RepID=A0A9N9L3H6_9HELO|nr:hypothetical protein HYFRA_00012352 [Hymenoscyphus fraxineus]